MVYTYYYSSVQESMSSICKTILPFSLKKRRHPAIDQRLPNHQSDNLKWQQDSFHQILNLMGLCKEGIVPATQVSAFRSHLLETLIASPRDHEPPIILRDKLIFLQELVYAKCISEEEYHASKRPLLQRLAVQGAEIEARNVIVGVVQKDTSNDEWSEIDLKDGKCSANQQITPTSNGRLRVKRMKAAVSIFGFASSDKNGKVKENDINNGSRSDEREGGFKSILMEESLPSPACVVADERKKGVGGKGKGKKTPLRVTSQREEGGGDGGGLTEAEGKEEMRAGKRGWGFDGFKKWRKNEAKHEIAPSSSVDEPGYGGKLVSNPVGEGPDTRQIKRKLHPNGGPSDFFVDKVVAENIKKQLSRIRNEDGDATRNINHLTDDEIETISMRLPADKADLNKLFPKSWCDQHGDVVLDVVRKEFKEHMREMGNQRHNKFDDHSSDPNL